MADADELIEVTQTCFVFRQKDDMVAGDFRRPCLFNRIKRLRIEVLALEVAVGNQIALHAENQLEVAALRRIVAERKGLHDTVVGNRQRLVPPANCLLHQVLHRRKRVHLAHLRMAVQLYALLGRIIHAHLFIRQALDAQHAHHRHGIEVVSVRRHVALQAQLHPRLEQILKLVAFLACVALLTLAEAQADAQAARFIDHVKRQDNITGAQLLLVEGLQVAVLIERFHKRALDDYAVLLLDNRLHLPRCALDFSAPEQAVVLLRAIQSVIGLLIGSVVRLRFRLRLARRQRCLRRADFHRCGFLRRQRNILRHRLACTFGDFHLRLRRAARQLAFHAVAITKHIHTLQRKSGGKLLCRRLNQALRKMGGAGEMNLPLAGLLINADLIYMHKPQLHQLHLRKNG